MFVHVGRFILAGLLCFAVGATSAPRAGSEKTNLKFALEMARGGNWREASYRWSQVVRKRPGDPKLLNNLAVAAEALGDPERAESLYRRAVALSAGSKHIDENRDRFERFWDREASREDAPELPPGTRARSVSGKTRRVELALPVPPRLDTTGYGTLLVASFLTDDQQYLDIDREIVRYVRSKLRKDPELELLDVTPAPAVPEQTVEQLIANSEFWKYLGREYGADIVVSGVVDFSRRDHSGFREVDRYDPRTGQKVRRTEFVEQERFACVVDVLFFSGSEGTLLFRDRLQRAAVYVGTANDPVTAFHDLTESLTPELMAIVEPRTRLDSRTLFVH